MPKSGAILPLLLCCLASGLEAQEPEVWPDPARPVEPASRPAPAPRGSSPAPRSRVLPRRSLENKVDPPAPFDLPRTPRKDSADPRPSSSPGSRKESPGRLKPGKGLRARLGGKPAPALLPPAAPSGIGPSEDPQVESGREGDALDEVLGRIGGFAAWRALGRLRIRRDLSGLDESGKEIFTKRFVHEAVLQGTDGGDRIDWDERLSFGKNGGRTWARTSGVDRPDLEKTLGPEVEVWGLLLRFPFGFRDRSRFQVQAGETVRLMGRDFSRIRVLSRRGGLGKVFGPDPRRKVETADRYDLYLDPETGLPLLLEMERRGLRRRILFGDWREVRPGGPRLPFERTILGEDGETPSLVIRWRALR